MDFLFNYYGLDWLAMIFSLIAIYYVGNRKRSGFLFFVTANALWIILGVLLLQSYGIVIGNTVFLIMNVRGFIHWQHKPTQS
jgi:hypothetical protein